MVLFLNLCSCFFFLYQASLLKSIPLRLYANFLAFNEGSLGTFFDWTNVSDMLLFSFETYPSCCKHYYHVMCSFVNVILSCQFHDFFWLLIKLIMRFKLILSPLSINFSLFYCFILFLFREKISDVIQIFCGYCKWLLFWIWMLWLCNVLSVAFFPSVRYQTLFMYLCILPIFLYI